LLTQGQTPFAEPNGTAPRRSAPRALEIRDWKKKVVGMGRRGGRRAAIRWLRMRPQIIDSPTTSRHATKLYLILVTV